jgi:cytochrome c oxidase subunit 4
MSSHAATADDHDDHGHGHGHGGGDHVPHVLPLKVYLATWGTLMVLTVITVAASYVDFGNANLWIALIIATMKASVVACLFMHLWFDHKFHALIFISSLVFLTIFVGFTMLDTEGRGKADAIEEQRVADLAAPFQGTTRDREMKRRWVEPPASALAVPGEPFATAMPSAAAPPPAPTHSAAPAGTDSAEAPAPSGSADAPPPAPSASAGAGPSATASAVAPPKDGEKKPEKKVPPPPPAPKKHSPTDL